MVCLSFRSSFAIFTEALLWCYCFCSQSSQCSLLLENVERYWIGLFFVVLIHVAISSSYLFLRSSISLDLCSSKNRLWASQSYIHHCLLLWYCLPSYLFWQRFGVDYLWFEGFEISQAATYQVPSWLKKQERHLCHCMHVGHSKGHFLDEDACNSVYDVSYYSTVEKFQLLSGLLVF